MDNNQPQVQAVRPVSKDNLDSSTRTTAPTVYFDCHLNPATGKSFVLWEDIRVVFTDALYVRHEAKMVPFMKDAEWMTMKPLRIAAIPDVVMDVIVDSPLVRLEAAVQQTTIADTPKEVTVQETPQEDTKLNLTTSSVSNAPRRNPVYGLVEVAMENYSHIDHPDFRPKPRAPQFVPTAGQEEGTKESAEDAPKHDNEPTNISAQVNNNRPTGTSQSHQSPQDHPATTAVSDIPPIVFKTSLSDAKSQVELGDMYRMGDGVEQDFVQARHWYVKAANQEYPAGQCNLGHLYRLELGVDRDHSTALSCAQVDIGYMYLTGMGVSQDETIALDWFSKAVSRKDVDTWSQMAMGLMYSHGLG
ncbi:hypothetical protein BGZ90_008203, partial [Linnemannia elongata]